MPRGSRALSAVLVVLLATSCGTTADERRPTPGPFTAAAAPPGTQPVLIPRHPDRRAIQVTEAELRAFMRKTLPQLRFSTPAGAVLPPFRVVPVAGEAVDLAMAAMVRQYNAWCTKNGRPWDCSGVLLDQPYLDASGKYKVAFDIALSAQWSGFADELRDMADPNKVRVVLLGAMVAYMAMLVFPGVVTQALAAAATFVLTAYLGAQTVWELVAGWLQMVREAEAATTFGELQAAGERYGRRVGANTARILVMVVTAMLAEGGLLARAQALPKAAEASAALAAETGGLGLAGIGQVGGVSVAENGVTVALTPPIEAGQQAVAMAMAARSMASTGRAQCLEEEHHIATVENEKSALRGGPWTPRFATLFKRAGLSMDSAANKVRVWGHRGPHPERYHQLVYAKLSRAVQGCSTTAACRAQFLEALQELANEIASAGSELNDLVTRRCRE